VPGQPIWQINVEIILLRVRIISGQESDWTTPIVKQENQKFDEKCPNSQPKPKADLIGDCCIKQVNQDDIKEHPDSGVKQLYQYQSPVYCF
jgi:hypothetical protein